jgi:hypothetical protein
MNLRQQIWCAVAAFPVMVYIFAYVSVEIDPYWYDGKPTPELIPPSERGGFALFIALFGFWRFLPILGLIIAILWLINRYRR